MENQIVQYIAQHQLCTKKDRILVAVSGGIDSMVLLHLLKKLGYEISIAHCNFKLRGKSSDRDEDFVRRQCILYELPFFSKSFDIDSYRVKSKTGIQEAARDLRYQWFSDVMEANNLDLLAVAHHVDDQIETVLLNVIRGAGIFGLSGMQPKRRHIIRPMLSIKKSEIIDYAHINNIEFREDSSNKESKYRRNYLRNKWLPSIEKKIPSFKNRMAENILIWQKSTRLLQGLIDEQLNPYKTTDGHQISLDLYRIEKSLRDLVVFRWLQPYGFNYSQVLQMVKCIEEDSSGKMFYSKKNRVSSDRKRLILSSLNTSKTGEILIERDQKTISLEEGTLEFKLLTRNDEIQFENRIAFLDLHKIKYPLKLRKWKPGDFFKPLGLKGKKQKIKKYFSNNKFNHFEKERQWLLCTKDRICWIVGERMDDRFKIDDSTKYVLKVIWQTT